MKVLWKTEIESVQKSINTNKEKDSIDEAEDEEPLITYNPVINESCYYKIFKCAKNLLNKLDTKCELGCMETSSDNKYTEMFKTLTDYNDRNNTSLSNEKIREALCKYI